MALTLLGIQCSQFQRPELKQAMKYQHDKPLQPADLDLANLAERPKAATSHPKSDQSQQAPFISPRPLVAAARLLDPVMLLAYGALTALIHPGTLAISQAAPYFLAASLTAALLVVALFQVANLYRLNVLLQPAYALPRLLGFYAGVFALIFAGVFFLQAGVYVSRVWLVGFALGGFFSILLGRFIFAALLRKLNRNGQLNRRAVLVGGGEPAAKVVSILTQSPDSGVNLVGYFDDRRDERLGVNTHGLERLGTVDNLIDFVRSTRVETLIITLPVPAEERLLQILNRLWILPVDIRLSAQGQKVHYRPHAYSYIGNLPCLDLYDRPLGEWGPFLKAATDKTLAAIALVLLSPVFLAVALAVKFTSKGPVFFKQRRFGFNNELVEVYKFRSMYTELTDANANKLVTKHDPRVTPVGRFIRRTSLDELPQIINVLKGDLSLVGPRPHATQAKAGEALYEHVVDGYFARHKMKPGITGWAQINGWRGETDTAEKIERRVEHDLYYIDNWSLTFDLYILARTPFALLSNTNAY
jgi:Undecaprenyl-phosphate glucose phosphotransferase